VEEGYASIMPCKYGSSLGPPGMERINPLMHMGPVKLDSARFSWKCDISVSTEFPTTTAGGESARGSGRVMQNVARNAVTRWPDYYRDILHPRSMDRGVALNPPVWRALNQKCAPSSTPTMRVRASVRSPSMISIGH